jgi:hypothetical protein
VSVRIITHESRRGGGVVVRVEGWLDADGAAELEGVVAGLSGRVSLELSGLKSADEAGLSRLRDLRGRSVALFGVSPYLRLLLGRRPRARQPGNADV